MKPSRENNHKNTCTGRPAPLEPDSATKKSHDTAKGGETSRQQKRKKTIDDYEIVNLPGKEDTSLGTGTFGEVKLVRDKAKPDKLYALKAVRNMSG